MYLMYLLLVSPTKSALIEAKDSTIPRSVRHGLATARTCVEGDNTSSALGHGLLMSVLTTVLPEA